MNNYTVLGTVELKGVASYSDLRTHQKYTVFWS